MRKQLDVQQIYRRKKEMRKHRAKMAIAEKLAVAEELRDLQKALAPIREANRQRVGKEQRETSK